MRPCCTTPRFLLACVFFISFSFFLTFPVSANVVPSWFVRSWLSDDGLPDNTVVGVVQDAQGYLWVATQGGLARFDGVRFRDYELVIPSQRSRPLIRQMLQGNDGAFWLALEGGVVVSLSSSRTNVFTAADGLSNFRPTSLAQASDGSIWVGYVDGSACRIAAQKVTRFTARAGLWGVGPCVLASDTHGQIWLAKAGELIVFRDYQFNFIAELPEGTTRLAPARDGGIWVQAGTQLLKVEESKFLENIATLNFTTTGVAPSAIYEDHSGAVWLGSVVGGLFRVVGTNVTTVPAAYPDILSITEDRENNVWTGTGGGGLSRLRSRIVDLQNRENGLPFPSVRSVCQDAAGVLWAVTQNGELAQRDTVSWNSSWRNVSTDGVWAGIHATCVISDGHGGVWVGTSHGGLRHWADGGVTALGAEEGLEGSIVRSLMTDRDGNLWVATESPSRLQCYREGTFQNYPLPSGIRPVRAIKQDTAGTIWVGTIDGYLFRVDNRQLLRVTSDIMPRSKPIRCLYADSAGDLWIGYAGAGLGRIHAGKFSNITTARGLQDDYICAMTEDAGGGFWFSSDHGIFQVRMRELSDALAQKTESVHSVLYGRDEALPSLQGNYGYDPSCMRTTDGRLWFPTRAGLAVVNPNQALPNHIVPPVIIEQVLVDNQPSPPPTGGVVQIPPRHRRIEIEFTALSFAAPDNVHFRYRLDGWDDNWVNLPPPQRKVNYTRLPAGRYQFHVIACNNAGIWNEVGATLTFNVEPFFWNTWWFRLAGMSALLGIVAVIVRSYARRKYLARVRKLEQEAALQKERGRIAKDIHDELGANLTQISLLGKFAQTDLREPEKAIAHVEKIAAIARRGVKSVDEIVWAVNPRNDNLSQLLDYAGQYAVDFLQSAGIRCRIDFPEKIPARELPAAVRHGLFMVVKEALNNAVKYSGAHEIILSASLAGDVLSLSVTDDGRGFSSAKADGQADGLRNMQQRGADLGGECAVESRLGHGTKVRVQLKLP
jgi:signal transduction histidine kinase/ligand-binding sensor domain-containing protein